MTVSTAKIEKAIDGSSNVVEEGSISPALDMEMVRREIVASNRELVKSSQFRKDLGQIQAVLDEAGDPVPDLGPIAQASTEKEMHRAVIAERYVGSEVQETDSWAKKTYFLERSLLTVSPMAMAIVLSAIYPVVMPVAMALGAVAFFPLLVILLFEEMGDFPEKLRNRVLRRKAYNKEVQRLLEVAEDTRSRHDRLRKVREAKINAARKALEPMAQDFSIAHPGKTLSIVGEDNTPFIRAVDDADYSELDRITTLMITEGNG